MSAGVKSMEFDSSGGLVWVGDEKVHAYMFIISKFGVRRI